MSRVDEALRRAGRATAGTESAPETALSPDRLELRRAWPAEPGATIAADAAPQPRASEESVADRGSAESSIFTELSLDELAQGLARKVVVDREMMPASREQYRRLAAALHQTQAANGLKVVLVVSAVAGEGKTLTAANLALTLSESYRRKVLLIDGDLRRPSLGTMFRIPAGPGLNEGLTSAAEQTLSLRPVTPGLMLLPAGAATPDPIAGLTGDRMRRLIEEARGTFDWVIVDTPPVGLLPDASLLSSMADGAVLVVRAEATHHDLVQRTVEALGRDRILGIVLNRAPEAEGAYYSYAYGYHRHHLPRIAGGESRT
jgi:capsular exopolysaccharide synthesis family protein